MFCFDKLRYNAKLLTLLAHTAFDHEADAQFSSDMTHIDGLAPVSEGRTAGDNYQVREARECRNDVFGDAVTQIAKVLVGAQIIVWKNCYCWNSGGDLLHWRRHPRAWPYLWPFQCYLVDLNRLGDVLDPLLAHGFKGEG